MELIMYKKLSVLLCCLMSLISVSVFANTCVNEIDKHVQSNNWLNLSSCHLQDQDLPIVASFITNHPSIYGLSISDNEISPAGIATVMSLSTVSALDLSHNNIGDEGAIALSKTKYISQLFMDHTNITGVGVSALAQSKVLWNLSIDNNKLNDNDLVKLANSSLRVLSVSDNNIGPNGAAIIAKMPALTSLDVSSNPIGNKGAIAIAKNNNLDFFLGAESCAITVEGARALSKLSKLLALDLSYNRLGDEGAAALAESRTIGILYLDAIGMSDKGAIALANLTTERSTRWLMLSHNFIKDEGAFALAKNHRFDLIDVRSNIIGKAGIDALHASGMSVWTDGNYSDENKRLLKNKYNNFICNEKDIKNCKASFLKRMREDNKL